MDDVAVIRSAQLAQLDGIAHGFLGRTGGVSRGAVSGLNVGLGSEDSPTDICENRRRAVSAIMPQGTLITLDQVHSSDVVTVTGAAAGHQRTKADAMVTSQAGLLLAVVTADCAPVLFADKVAGVVAAAHAGWRGAAGGVIEATLEAMERIGSRREHCVAAIGPAIAQVSYEVDRKFLDQFADTDAQFFNAGRADHWQFDLEAYIHHRLTCAGVAKIDALGIDTYADEERFFSFRRATHRAEATYGRQFSMIGLE